MREFLRGAAFRAAPGVPYPRARDDARLPRDTWAQACVPAGVRLELVGDAEAVVIRYRTEAEGIQRFQLWRGGALVSEQDAVLGEGTVRLAMGGGPAGERAVVYLPEWMRTELLSVDAEGGSIEPAPRQPRWVAYGDSILEGWTASAPALAWAARVSRERGLDLVNMGYAGCARGELVSAEHVASREAAVYSLTHGTNCWAAVPHSVAMMRAEVDAFLDVLRQERPDTPVVVASPVLRPDAEDTPNRLGASLADLRGVMEEAVAARADANLHLVPGRDMIDESGLDDGIHPNDAGHAAMAAALGPAIAAGARAALRSGETT